MMLMSNFGMMYCNCDGLSRDVTIENASAIYMGYAGRSRRSFGFRSNRNSCSSRI